MRKYAILLLFAAPLLLAVSCKDKDKKKTSVCDVNPGNCQTISEAKDFFYFKVGSWWVYEEETSHVRDSMYVTEAAENPDGYEFDVRIKSALTDYTYHYWPEYYGTSGGCSTVNPVNKKCVYIKRGKGKPLDNLGENIIFFVRYKKGDTLWNGNELSFCPESKIKISEIFETYQLAQFQFQNVVQIDNNCDYPEGKQPTRILYGNNIGTIRKELLDSNQIWNLVDYHIEE